MKYRKNFLILLLLVLLTAGAVPLSWSREQPPYIEELLKGDDAIVVTGTGGAAPIVTLGRRFGGSVVSLYYRGVEYVNNNDSLNRIDYGRQLQSAVHYRDAGECFNPTEAGGRYDKNKASSSSRLVSVDRPGPNAIVTQTEMAFWMGPGEEKILKGKKVCTALNTEVRAGYLLKRTLQVGVEGFPNVIYYQTQFVAPMAEPNARYVPVAIHTPANFARAFSVDAQGNAEEIVGRNAQRGTVPHMIATDDLRHAVVVCWAKPTGETFYGFRRVPNTTASRYAYFAPAPEKESPVFRSYVIVGTAAEVRNASRKFCFES
jgi:hypothetical protein